MNIVKSSPPVQNHPSVVHLATTDAGGAGIAARRTHEALRRLGVPSHLLVAVTDDPAGPDKTILDPRRPTLVQRIRRRVLPDARDRLARNTDTILAAINASARPELFSLPHSRCKPEWSSRVASADIVHFHWVSGFVDLPRFFGAIQKPVVWTLHDQQPYLGGFHYALDRERCPALHGLDDECVAIKGRAFARLRASFAVIGNSVWNTQAAQTSSLFPPDTRFETIYYPLDTSRFVPREKSLAKAALGVEPDRFVVGFASSDLSNSRKGLADLLSALHKLETHPDAPKLSVLSFGRPPTDDAREIFCAPWHHLGFLSEDTVKCAAYSAMDCFVIPSRAEAFGLTAIEALACETAVIGSRVGGIVEALDEGRCGMLVEPGDVQAIADRLFHLATHSAERTALAKAGRTHVLARHAPERCANQHLRLYGELLQRAHC